jgi:hypothetical protein
MPRVNKQSCSKPRSDNPPSRRRPKWQPIDDEDSEDEDIEILERHVPLPMGITTQLGDVFCGSNVVGVNINATLDNSVHYSHTFQRHYVEKRNIIGAQASFVLSGAQQGQQLAVPFDDGDGVCLHQIHSWSLGLSGVGDDKTTKIALEQDDAGRTLPKPLQPPQPMVVEPSFIPETLQSQRPQNSEAFSSTFQYQVNTQQDLLASFPVSNDKGIIHTTQQALPTMDESSGSPHHSSQYTTDFLGALLHQAADTYQTFDVQTAAISRDLHNQEATQASLLPSLFDLSDLDTTYLAATQPSYDTYESHYDTFRPTFPAEQLAVTSDPSYDWDCFTLAPLAQPLPSLPVLGGHTHAQDNLYPPTVETRGHPVYHQSNVTSDFETFHTAPISPMTNVPALPASRSTRKAPSTRRANRDPHMHYIYFHHNKWSEASWKNKQHGLNYLLLTLYAHILLDDGTQEVVEVAVMMSAGMVVRGRSPEACALSHKRKMKWKRLKARQALEKEAERLARR